MNWDSLAAKPLPEPNTKDAKVLSDVIQGVLTEERIEITDTPVIRASKLPMCILIHSFDLLAKPPALLKSPRLEHYGAIGTALHEFWQDLFMKSSVYGKYVYGDFKCRNVKCNTIMERDVLRPGDYTKRRCSKCGWKGLKYSEIEARYKGVLGIHVDLLLKFDKTFDFARNQTWLVDFKTTSSFNIDNPKFTFKSRHLQQIETYPLVLEAEKDIKVDKFFLAYINRDKPIFSQTSKGQHRIFSFDNYTKRTKARLNRLDSLVEAEHLRRAYFKDTSINNLKKLDIMRPCKTEKDYTKKYLGMQDFFTDSGNECPYANSKGCFRGGLSKPAKELHKHLIRRH